MVNGRRADAFLQDTAFKVYFLLNLAVKKEEITYDAGKRRSTPTTGTGHAAGEKQKPLDALNDTAVGQKASQALKTVTGTAAKVQRNPVIAHCCAPQSASMTGWAISSARPSPISRSCR
jgi:hypothetical protein